MPSNLADIFRLRLKLVMPVTMAAFALGFGVAAGQSSGEPSDSKTRKTAEKAPKFQYFGNIAAKKTSIPRDDWECAAQVRRDGWEARPDNAPYNNTTAPAGFFQADHSSGHVWATYSARITGNFTGTTDEILQWVSCKWGFDEDLNRAIAIVESWWNQSSVGDTWHHGNESYGLMGVRRSTWPGWPWTRDSTATNVDVANAVRRTCLDGGFGWLGNGYGAGDLWGCVEYWFTGGWWPEWDCPRLWEFGRGDPRSCNYTDKVATHMWSRTWTEPHFAPQPTQPPPEQPPPGSSPGGCEGVVVLYEHDNFSGRCKAFGAGDHSYVGDDFNDMTTSVQVADGHEVVLYEHGGFNGAETTVGSWDDPNLWDDAVGNDAVSSLRVR